MSVRTSSETKGNGEGRQFCMLTLERVVTSDGKKEGPSVMAGAWGGTWSGGLWPLGGEAGRGQRSPKRPFNAVSGTVGSSAV